MPEDPKKPTLHRQSEAAVALTARVTLFDPHDASEVDPEGQYLFCLHPAIVDEFAQNLPAGHG
jgi:hypothetical protein